MDQPSKKLRLYGDCKKSASGAGTKDLGRAHHRYHAGVAIDKHCAGPALFPDPLQYDPKSSRAVNHVCHRVDGTRALNGSMRIW